MCVCVKGGWRALAGCRVAQGLSQAGYYPALHSLLARWVPLSERGSLSSYVYTGNTLTLIHLYELVKSDTLTSIS